MNYLRNATTSYSLINVNVFQNGSLEFPVSNEIKGSIKLSSKMPLILIFFSD